MVTKITAIESPTKDRQLTGIGQWLEERCCELMLGVWHRHTERFVAGGKAVGEWLGLWSGTTDVQADRLNSFKTPQNDALGSCRCTVFAC